MNKESTGYLELLEKRIAMLNSLSHALVDARSAMISFDIESLESRITDQQELCSGIQTIDQEIDKLQYQCAAHLPLRSNANSTGEEAHLGDALARLHAVQNNVKQLTDAHQAVLRRSKTTVTALLNSIRSFEGTYQQTALAQTSGKFLQEEQV